MDYYCSKCNEDIPEKVYLYSKENYGKILCRNCQQTLILLKNIVKEHDKKGLNESEINKFLSIKGIPEKIIRKATLNSKKLYIALIKRKISARLEHWDGYKSIDLAIPQSKINIEVDGKYHQNSKQALSDLKRTYYSFRKGYFTFRIPNILIEHNLEDTADLIEHIITSSQEQIEEEADKELKLLLMAQDII